MSRRLPIINLLRNLHLKRHAAKIAASPLFMASWYLNRYPDVREAGVPPAQHYTAHGRREGRWPNPLFDPVWFDRNAPHDDGRTTPLERYLKLPEQQRPPTHPLFDPDWYRLNAAGDLQRGEDALEHFLFTGGPRGLSPHPAFDAAWYLDRYPDVREAGVNPLCHYLEFGVSEGRDPNPYFDTAWYAHEYLHSADESLNPLVHYLLTGRSQGLAIRPPPADPLWWDSLQPAMRFAQPVFPELNSTWKALQRRREGCAGITVIIPVHNAANEVRECLHAVATCTPQSVHLLVIDDASTDPEIDAILRAFTSDSRFRIERNESNLGYTRTINRGLDLAGTHDVVLLNSDTMVGPGWLARLTIAAYRQDRIATVTALSNNAGAFSAPETNRENPLPDGVAPVHVARAVAQASTENYPETPTGNGFCMYVRRACLDEIGQFDEQSFPRGYGEENDFCMRARMQGWLNLIDASIWVFHHRSASFGAQRETLVAAARRQIQRRYPEYDALVGRFLASDALASACARVGRVQESVAGRAAAVKPRVLYVLGALHESGGTTQTNRDLMDAIGGEVETWLLRSDARRVELMSYRCGEEVLVEHALLADPIEAFPHASREYDVLVAGWLRIYAIDLIHIRHVAHHGLGLVSVARQMFVPVVFSFHDFYTVCPTVKLLDERMRFCGGKCTPGEGPCIPELWPAESMPPLKHAAIHDWQRSFGQMLSQCDALVSTSATAREIVLENYPALREKPFEIVPHGRDFDSFNQLAPEIEPKEPIRILVPGNLTGSKGAGLVTELARRFSTVEVHVLGRWLAGNPPEQIILHGPYQRHEFCDRVREIRPHVGAVLSIWPETWCHTLTELWAAGIPVVGCDFGAVGERIRSHGGGWLLPAATSDAFATLLARLRQDPEEHAARMAESAALAARRGQAAVLRCNGRALPGVVFPSGSGDCKRVPGAVELNLMLESDVPELCRRRVC